jgi:hypothetical protein
MLSRNSPSQLANHRFRITVPENDINLLFCRAYQCGKDLWQVRVGMHANYAIVHQKPCVWELSRAAPAAPGSLDSTADTSLGGRK